MHPTEAKKAAAILGTNLTLKEITANSSAAAASAPASAEATAKSKKRPASSASSSSSSESAAESEPALKKKFKTKAEVELALEKERKESKEMREELKILRDRVQKNAENEWLKNWTCSVCQEKALMPIKVCKAQSKHIACLDCAVRLASSCFVVPDHSVGNHPWELELTYHFNGSSDAKTPVACCPECRHPSPVLKVEDFVLGRMFAVFPETVYAQIRELAKDLKPNVSVELKCCWQGCDTLALTTTELVLHVFECKRRLFHCPIGLNPFQSHRPRAIECKEQFSLFTADKTTPFLEQYQTALRTHAVTSCITRVGSCTQCPTAELNTAAYGIPTCEISHHLGHHRKVHRFWDLVYILLYDIFQFYDDRQFTPPLQASQLGMYEKALDQLVGAYGTVVTLMESGHNCTDEERKTRKEMLQKIPNGKKWMNGVTVLTDLVFDHIGNLEIQEPEDDAPTFAERVSARTRSVRERVSAPCQSQKESDGEDSDGEDSDGEEPVSAGADSVIGAAASDASVVGAGSAAAAVSMVDVGSAPSAAGPPARPEPAIRPSHPASPNTTVRAPSSSAAAIIDHPNLTIAQLVQRVMAASEASD
jgi:hypothetical protein